MCYGVKFWFVRFVVIVSCGVILLSFVVLSLGFIDMLLNGLK